MQPDWSEFMQLMLVFLLSLISPGADFFLVIRQAVLHGRRAAFVSSLGIGTGLVIHVSYTILGLSLVASQLVFLFHIVKWAGVAYLVFLGIHALLNRGSIVIMGHQDSATSSFQSAPQSTHRAFILGLGVNLLNPKAILFFISIFSVLIAPQTPIGTQFFYCMILILIAVSWFSVLSFVMTLPKVTQTFSHMSKWIDCVTGVVFIGLGVRLMFQEIS